MCMQVRSGAALFEAMALPTVIYFYLQIPVYDISVYYARIPSFDKYQFDYRRHNYFYNIAFNYIVN